MTSTQLTCATPCDPKCPQPVAASSNEPCVVACPDSRVIIFPPPVVVTFPGPILTTFPQQTVVGSSDTPEVTPTSLGTDVTPRPDGDKVTAAPALARPEPRCAPKYSYTYSSQWTHPCNSYRAGKRW
ncbi:hypothetical protein HGM15179_020967 [Zosterops borbonicus]|uniref:Keratin n=1 Tax=Zosterops borbonicus TaxID=364589 RepID=A0A8K1D6N4_9PASS|nr:hypothetical protein HGM15179_020967 [Zosterops borbonicus]